jgi:cytochrome c oxidase subunit 2
VNVPVDQHVLVPKGPQAAHIADLWWFYLIVMVLVCVLVWACILIALIRRDARTEQPALDEQTLASLVRPERSLRALSPARERRHQRWVMGAIVATIAILFGLLFRSVHTSKLLAQLPQRDVVHLEVVGHRWWWELRYSERDVSLSFTTANELHIPVGRPVELKLRAADVIHSFWVPNLHGKRDLVPGRDTTLLLQADEAGTYRGQCAEFCGTAHARMALWVVAEPQAQFERWKLAQRALPAPPTTDEAARGQQLFTSGPCAMCHTVAGSTAQSSLGPDLTHVASRRSLAAATLPNTRGHLAGWLLNAPNIKPGTQMPSMSLEAAQLHALVAYLEGLR